MNEEQHDWWRDFFTGPAADVVRQLATAEQTSAECEFLIRTLGLEPGERILDVPCGDGRLSLELARRGYISEGVDFATELLNDARTTAAQENLPAEFHQQDMRSFHCDNLFAAAFCFGNSFGYFEDAGNRAFLESVFRALRPGALFILESRLVAESLYPQFQPRRWFPFSDSIMFIDSQLDCAPGILRTEYSFLRDGVLDRRRAQFRIHTLRELIELTNEAGFELVDSLSSIDGSPFSLGSPGTYLVLRRRE
ncbi:MAG: methyltransferase domain-containing protein [Acidobacteriota bacterium]